MGEITKKESNIIIMVKLDSLENIKIPKKMEKLKNMIV